MAPHLAEEAWEILGGKGELTAVLWPTVDEKYLKQDIVTYVVQINGKVRGKLEMAPDQSEEAVLAAAKADVSVQKHLNGAAIRKVIFVPNRLLNIVIG